MSAALFVKLINKIEIVNQHYMLISTSSLWFISGQLQHQLTNMIFDKLIKQVRGWVMAKINSELLVAVLVSGYD